MEYWSYSYSYPEGDDFCSPALGGFGYAHVWYRCSDSLLHTDSNSRQNGFFFDEVGHFLPTKLAAFVSSYLHISSYPISSKLHSTQLYTMTRVVPNLVADT